MWDDVCHYDGISPTVLHIATTHDNLGTRTAILLIIMWGHVDADRRTDRQNPFGRSKCRAC